jgi:4-hydroxybenzoate polyprenyltransferase
MLAINHTNRNLLPSQIFTISRKEIIYGGYIPALVGPSLVITTASLTDVGVSIPILIISYLIPLIVYSFDYYKDMDNDQHTNYERAVYFKRKSKIYPYMLASYLLILSILVIFFTNWMMISFISILVLVSIVYPLGLKRFTKFIPGFKNMFTIFIWAIAGTFSLAVINMLEISAVYLLIFLFFYLKMLPNTIFFFFSDVKNDAQEKLKTIPVILGKIKTLKLMYILNFLAFIPLFIGIWLQVIPIYASLMVLFLFYSIYYLNKSFKLSDKEINPKFFILADLEFIFWPALLILGNLALF